MLWKCHPMRGPVSPTLSAESYLPNVVVKCKIPKFEIIFIQTLISSIDFYHQLLERNIGPIWTCALYRKNILIQHWCATTYIVIYHSWSHLKFQIDLISLLILHRIKKHYNRYHTISSNTTYNDCISYAIRFKMTCLEYRENECLSVY